MIEHWIIISIWVLAGVILGTIAGVLPGFSASVAIALLLPFTFAMKADIALCFLGGVFAGGLFGGAITAILVKIPGAPSNIATVFDGYPLSKKGMAQEAIFVATLAAAIGGLLGVLTFIFLSPVLAKFALRFGPAEEFWVSIFALTTLASLSTGNIFKGVLSGLFGLFLGVIGLDPVEGRARFTFGRPELCTGIPLAVALIGFFAVSEAFSLFEKKGVGRFKKYEGRKGVFFPMLKWVFTKPLLVLSSAIIGIITGLLPGTGGSVAGILAYNETKRFSKKREQYGTGILEGVLAPETAANATEGGALTPMLTLGIPGSAAAAALMGTLTIHGLIPGPNLYVNEISLVHTFMIGLILAQFLLVPVGLVGAKVFTPLLKLSNPVMGSIVLGLAIVGTFALTGTHSGLLILLFCGIVGYFMEKFGFSRAPAVIGLVLSYTVEYSFQLSTSMAGGVGSVFRYFMSRPISVVLMVLCVLSLATTVFLELKEKPTIPAED
ncbi:MAG: tripartite tricarboxylate transporter permease [Nitrospirae bacterium]|nr:tripartite tricarboxylate transporter permease [Nitrospirota bacterium]